MWKSRTTLNIALAGAAALALAACNKAGTPQTDPSAQASGALPALPAAIPLQAGAATAIAPAPAPQALPVQQRVRVAQVANRSDAYAYLDRAQGVTQAIGDAPPDYTYDDGGVSPWVWQTSLGDRRYAEPIDGGYRYYYYQSGSDTPYLVRDPQYSYAYSGPQLVAVYDQRGALLPPDVYESRADYASRYYDRAAYLYRLSREREHQGVIAANWAARRAEIAAARAQWSQDMAQQAQWRAYHDAHEAQEREHWQGESARRAAEAQRFDQWQRVGFRSPPPPPVAYVPVSYAPQPQRSSGWLPNWFNRDRQAQQDAQRRQALQQQQQQLQQQRQQIQRQRDQQAAMQRAQRQIAAQQEQQRARQQQISREQAQLAQQRARLQAARQQDAMRQAQQRQAEQARRAAQQQHARDVAQQRAQQQQQRAQQQQRMAQAREAQQRQVQQDRARQQAAQRQVAQARRQAAQAQHQAAVARQQAAHAQAQARQQQAQARAQAQRAAHADHGRRDGGGRHPG